MYSALSKYYDALMNDFNYDAYEAFLCKNLPSGFGYDLACGSAEMTIRLKRNGYDIVGGDISPEMLEKAREKAKINRYNIQFFVSDLNDISLTKKSNFITVVCDGFNYVKPKNIQKAFATIYDNLLDGGVFVFDISSEYKLKNTLGNNLFYEDNDDLTYFWQNTLKKDLVKMDLTFFEKSGDVYKRFDETESQYIHKDADIFVALDNCGFKYDVFDGKFSAYKKGADRLVVVARK